MKESKKRRAQLFGLEDVDEILETAEAIAVRKIIEPIEIALDNLKESVAEMKLLPGVDRIVLRVQTIQRLLDSVMEDVGRNRYRKLISEAGEDIGRSFAHDTIDFLMDINRLPADEKVLIEFWNKLDTYANWGYSKTEFEGTKIIVEIENNFVAKGLTEDKHRHCTFTEGYIKGFLWEALKEHYRWFSREITRPATSLWEPVAVSEKKGKDSCIFVVERKEEELSDAFNNFYDAKVAFRLGNYQQAVISIRRALESALKQKIGLGIYDKTASEPIMTAYSKSGILPSNLSFQKIKDIWGSTSAVVHKRKLPSKEKCEKMIKEESKILRIFELMEIDENSKTKVLNELQKFKRK